MNILTTNTKSNQANLMRNLLKMAGFQSVEQFQKEKNLQVDGYFGEKTWSALYKTLLNVINVQFEGHYFKEKHVKNQIVWHHSAGWDNARGMFEAWKNDKVRHVATSIGISDNGDIYKGFEEEYWAHHIGMSNSQNYLRNAQSVAVEVCNWGALSEKGGKLYSWANVEVPRNKAIELNYKGSRYYEKYTAQEINSLKIWTLLIALKYNIPLTYRSKDMWELSSNAINGVAGIYTHNSYISWKSDVSPQPELINMAISLNEYTK